MDSKNKELLKKTTLYSIGNFGSKVLSFAMIPLYSFYLDKNEFGYFDLISTIVALTIPLGTLQLTDSLLRWLLLAKNEESKSKVITNSFIITIISIIIIFIILFIARIIWDIPHQSLISILLITSIIYPLAQQITRGLGENKLFAINGVIFTFIYLILNVVFLIYFELKIEALFLSTIISNVICFANLLYVTKFYKYFNLKYFNIVNCKEYLKYSIPLIPNTISWWLINSANKFIILYFLTLGANGLFGMANRFPSILIMINSIFIMAWQESAIIQFNKDGSKEFFSNILEKLFSIQAFFGSILILLSHFVVSKFIDPIYYDSWKLMPILYLSVIFSSISGFYGSIYLGAKQTNGIFKTTISAGIFNVIAAFILTKYFGLIGVAIGTCLGFMMLTVIRYFDTKRFMVLDYSNSTFWIFSLLLTVSIVLSYINNSFLTLIGIFLIFLVVIIMKKNQISVGYLKIKNKINEH